MFPIFFPPEGNFDIDAGDEDGGGPLRTPQIPPNHKKIKKQVRPKIVHTSGTCLKASTNTSTTVAAAAVAAAYFMHSCSLPYVIYCFIFDLICYFY